MLHQWVQSTAHQDTVQRELERFAYDIAESVVNTMENRAEKVEAKDSKSGVFHALKPSGSHGSLHGPVYLQEVPRRVGMTFQQEDRRRQELRDQEEDRRLQELRRQEEINRLEIEKRAAVEAYRRQQEQEEEIRRRKEEMERREAERLEMERKEIEKREAERREAEIKEAERREAERREAERREAERREAERREAERREAERRDAEKREAERREIERKEAERREAERLEYERLRYEQLRQEEEAKRLEEIRLEQEIRRQYELQQAQQLKKSHTAAAAAGHHREEESSLNVRSHLPRLSRASSFHRVPDQQQQQLDNHLGKVRTGQVNEKRDFWNRSSSMDRLHQAGAAVSSPSPRRRRLDSWNNKENAGPGAGDSRPGSALDNTGTTRNSNSAFITRSKSSAAVSGHEVASQASPTVAALRSLHAGSSGNSAVWSKEKYDQQTSVMQQQSITSHRFQEVHTNQVTETVTAWGSQQSLNVTGGGRTTPTPSRTISQGFAESRSMAAGAAPVAAWRTATTPEPSLRLVNVSVESCSQGSSSKMQQMEESRGTSSSKRVQPPQPPNRNQSYAVAERYLSH